MWVAKKTDWDDSWNDEKYGLVKYFLERIKQKVDYKESISNRHSTTCGFTLIDELIEVGYYVVKREKTINRFRSLLNESLNNKLNFSLVNDVIIQKYHGYIIDYFKNYSIFKNINSIRIEDVPNIQNKLLIFRESLKNNYYNNIQNELKNINFEDVTKFDRTSKEIDSIVQSLIPYLIHVGYSPISISDISYRYIKKVKNQLDIPLKFITLFEGKRFDYDLAIILNQEKDKDLIQPVLDKFKELNSVYEFDYLFCNIESYKDRFNSSDILSFTDTDLMINIKVKCIDPHSFLRKLYDFSLKYMLIIDYEYKSVFIENYFNTIYWRFLKPLAPMKYLKSDFDIDPINIKLRNSTLHATLSSLSYLNLECDKGKVKSMPFPNTVRDSLIYYNLALRTRSIENSFLLLWTSLETLIPFHEKNSDIESIQEFVSSFLSVGSIGREISSFIRRIKTIKKIHEDVESDLFSDLFKDLKYNNPNIVSKQELKLIYEILSKPYTESTEDKTYEWFKNYSELATCDYLRLNNVYSNREDKIKYWENKIGHSKEAIKLQLDRIYLHRNQIVHSGKLINEYSNLWGHLEWYIGKLLSVYIIYHIQHPTMNKYEIYVNIYSEIIQIEHYLEKIKKSPNLDLDLDLFEKMMIDWQF